MKNLSWTDVAVDRDHNYTSNETFSFMATIEQDGATPVLLACALLERAQSIMDYQDPMEYYRNERKETVLETDQEFVQINRLMNFMETISDFTDKRLALLDTGDEYLQRKVEKYSAIKKRAQIDLGFDFTPESEELDYNVVIEYIEGFEQDLIIEGISRLTIAKVFMECAFVFAKTLSKDDFIRFCYDLKVAMGHDVELSELLPAQTNILQGQESASIHEGSTSIH